MQNPSRIRRTLATLPIFLFNFSFLIFNLFPIPPALSHDISIDKALARVTNGLSRFVLDNGMIGLVKEDHTAPVVSIQIWVGIGSADEQEYLGGGLSHWMEHMIFKGTPTRPPGNIAKAIDDAGGSISAYTSMDRTVFLTDIPASHWRTGLAILADAVMNASFPEDEWQREKEVILREMAMEKDNPDRQLSHLLSQTTYRVHPYRVPVIGYEAVFNTLTRQDLLTFFRRHYTPDNMIVVMVGDFRASEAGAALREQFSGWLRRPTPPVVLPAEPEQIADRLARRAGAYAVTRLEVAWHTVALSHPDAPELDMLAVIVGNGRSARLARTIKEKQKLAHQISAWSFTPKDPGLFGISAICDPAKESALLEAIDAEVRQWTSTPFALDEVEKARRIMLTGTLSEFQTMHGQARNFASGEFYAGTPLFFQTYLQRLNRVSPASLTAVARKYLRTENRTIAVLSPASKGSEAAESQPAVVAGEVKKIILSNDLPLLIREDHKVPFTWFCAASGGGLLLENETNNGITRLMAELMIRGTRRYSSEAIAQTIESLGASLTAFSGHNSFGLQAQCLSQDASVLMDVIAECLLHPAFTPEEIEKQKSVQLAAIAQQRESPFFIAQEALRQALFPGHPYRFSPEGKTETVGKISRDQLLAWHAKLMVNGNAVFAMFGDITVEQARALAETRLKHFPSGARPAPEGRKPHPTLPQRASRSEPREQTIILAGFPGVTVNDPRNDALNILQQVMSGLSSDLLIAIRDQRGLAYYAGALQQPGVEPGFFAVYAGTRESALEQVEALMMKEIHRVAAQGIRQDELERAKQKLTANHQNRLQLNGEMALECALDEWYGRGYGYSFELAKRLQSVSRETVRATAAEILNTNRMAVAIVEPESDTME